MLTIDEELKRDTLSQVHLLYGEEWYMVRYYKRMLMEKLTVPGDDMNCAVFQGEAAKAPDIADVGQLLPFMASQRVILIQESGFFKSANDMPDILETFPASTYVIFVEREVDRRSRLYKWVASKGCVTECKSRNVDKLVPWIGAYLKKNGKAISARTAEHLIERVGTDMEFLNNEMDKLIGYAGERDSIGLEDVDAVCSGVAVSRIFDMIDAVSQGERDRALRLYDDLLANRESPLSILHLFSRHINILLQYKELFDRGLNRNEMARKIGVPPFTIAKYGKQADMFRKGELLAMLNNRLEYEENFKQGNLSDQLAAEMFLIQALTNR